jgi:hypothetical protein
MKKYFLLLMSFVLLNSPSIAQGVPNSAYINLEKYWFYRYRLVNDFMKIGENCGESIPAQDRNAYPPNALSRIEWGDATIDLGNYISMLATEHRMLSNNVDTKNLLFRSSSIL